MPPESMQHFAKLIGADAAVKAYGEPVPMLAMDWNSLVGQFKKKILSRSL